MKKMEARKFEPRRERGVDVTPQGKRGSKSWEAGAAWLMKGT